MCRRDGIVDQDTATHDPTMPLQYRPAFNAGDFLHPNDAGSQAISDAVNFGDFEDNGLPPVTKSMPVGLAKFAGWTLEKVYKLFHLPGEPAMTRFVANQLSTSHWYDISAARRDLGYIPLVSTEEGLTRIKKI